MAAIALVAFRQGLRLRLWLLAPLALAVAIITDLSSPRFDPVFDAIPAAVGTSLLVMTVLVVILAVFFATYPTPAEMDSRVAYTLMTKPVARWEIVAGKVLGLALLLAAMLAIVGVGAYAYVRVRAEGIRSLAARRLEEVRGRTECPADLNPLQAVALDGPLGTYRYREASAGPDFQVRFAGGRPEAPGVVWVVGQTGMRLRWRLTDSPLREWTASGPGHIEIALAAHRSPGADQEPVKVGVRLVARRSKADRAAGPDPSKKRLVQDMEVAVPESGTVRVPVVRAGEKPPPEGTFGVPDEGDLFLEVLASHPKHVVGAEAGAVRIVGPGGLTARLDQSPERLAAVMGSRQVLVGCPEPPRQMAVFRFDDVPAGLLGDGDAAVEIAFSLDAFSPATVQPAARATFIRPDTGASQSFQFTPEGHHPTLLYLDRDFWHGGPLRVSLECLTRDDYMGLLPESIRLRLGGDTFVVHLAKGALCVLLFGTVLTAAAVFLSTRLSWFVSILAMVALFAIGTGGRILLSYGVIGELAESVAKRLEPVPGGAWLLDHLQLQGLLPADTFNMGEAVPWWDLGASLALVLVVTAVLVAAGAYLLRTREVAA
ncbi:MAG: hypothetical protein U9R68_01450 [Planctomycetota bacterium]|nr:hypothetical protein [Planctomycetota bacterium]